MKSFLNSILRFNLHSVHMVQEIFKFCGSVNFSKPILNLYGFSSIVSEFQLKQENQVFLVV